MQEDYTGFEVLGPDECMHLLATQSAGRIAATHGALPVILPVNYALLDGNIVIRTTPIGRNDSPLDQQVVCLEVGTTDPASHDKWSVVVTGRAAVVSDPEILTRARDLALRRWSGTGDDDRDSYVTIRPELISGHRVLAASPRSHVFAS